MWEKAGAEKKGHNDLQWKELGSSFYTQEMGGGDSTGEGGQNIHGRCTRSGLRRFHKWSSS